jgi:phospholipase A1
MEPKHSTASTWDFYPHNILSMRHTLYPALASALFLASPAAQAAQSAASFADCGSIANAEKRLACFDQTLAAHSPPATEPVAVTAASEQPSKRESSHLEKHWELTPGDKRGTFDVRTHQPNYVLFANHTNAPNNVPFYGPRKGQLVQTQADFTDTEIQYQFSLKTKLLEDIGPAGTDIWAGYTQNGNWQAYNRALSYPLRDVTHQPEVMMVTPVHFQLLGMQAKFVNLGLVHQSNGRSARTSRSWNRVYAQLGMERGDLSLVTRVWKRLADRIQGDGNPGIIDYYGHGDMTATYRHNGHRLSLGGRYNFDTTHGAIQADWAFPLTKNLKGYVQAFSGYGQTLIDYNHQQSTVGIGVLLDY